MCLPITSITRQRLIRLTAVYLVISAGTIQSFTITGIQKQIKSRPVERINGVQLPVQHDTFFPAAFARVIQSIINPDAVKVHFIYVCLCQRLVWRDKSGHFREVTKMIRRGGGGRYPRNIGVQADPKRIG